MQSHRLHTVGLDRESRWVQIALQPIGDRWGGMILADGAESPGPKQLKGTAFCVETAEEAERLAKVCLDLSEPVT